MLFSKKHVLITAAALTLACLSGCSDLTEFSSSSSSADKESKAQTVSQAKPAESVKSLDSLISSSKAQEITTSKAKDEDVSHSDDSAPSAETPVDSSEPQSDVTESLELPDAVLPNQFDEYSEILEEYRRKCDEDRSYRADFCRYFTVDIDDDGVYELLAEMGTCEADRTVSVYTYDEDGARELGSFISWHASFGEDEGVLYSETSAMGGYILTTITIENGRIVTERDPESTAASRLFSTLTGYSYDDLTGLEIIK